MSLIPHCDLCQKKMTTEELAASQNVAQSYMLAHQDRIGIVIEIGCESHAGALPVFWDEKWDILQDSMKQVSARYQNHRNRFLQDHKRRLEAVK